ncbi:Bardet-Biedl syndrome 12 protein [Sceloporus undulatus]|uniref:Bardet-Biedl syndrome 12 protein n=1 Tax=Sceloporus undulatus TaxID=8520 RepID=UPI001C4ADD04|nr:Bardet-Biedl syndrome 12 protein [Sceloporus undulatus]
MAFRNMNSKRHIGLQQLSALASTGRTLLGPVKSSKFIVDESTPDGMLICSAVRLLENLDLNCAVGQLLNDTIQAQDQEYKTGTTTLLFLVSAWSNAVLECLQQDVPLSVIVSLMSESLNSCIEYVQGIALSLHSIQQRLDDIPRECEDKVSAIINTNCSTSGKQIVETKTPGLKSNSSILTPFGHLYECEEKSEDLIIQQAKTCNFGGKCGYQGIFDTGITACSSAKSVDTSRVSTAYKTVIDKRHSLQNCHLDVLNCNQRLKVTHSRYFSSVKKKPSPQQPDQVGESTKHFDGINDLGQLTMSLSHGNWPAMKLVQDILRYQLHNVNKMADTCPLQFNVSEVVTCCLPGVSEAHSCAYPGYITLVCPEKAAITKIYQDRPLRVILVDGNLTKTYHHLGFNRSQNVRILFESASDLETGLNLWIDSMLDILIQSGINLVLVQGETCEILEERCLSNNIVVINRVAHNVLRAFSVTTGAERVTYLTQVNEHCVGKGVCMKLCGTPELSGVGLNDQMLVSLTAKGITLTTVVLGCPLMSKMQAIEDNFWTCAYRVHHALLDQAVFPGGGVLEFLCLSYLGTLEKTAETCKEEFNTGSSWLSKSSEQYQPLVLSALACGWHQYLCTIMCNMAHCTTQFEASTFIQQHLQEAAVCDSPTAYILDEFNKGRMGVASTEYIGVYGKALKVYDNVGAKTEAWRRALDLVLLVLQTDAEIITGPKRDQLLKSQLSSEFLFL